MERSTHDGVERVIVLRDTCNARDLGGLIGADGALVRRGRILRSDYPAFATVENRVQVEHVGLRSVVDLRRGIEAAVECPAWDQLGVAYSRTPLSAGETDSWHARYVAYLQHRPETVVEAVRQVMDVGRQPVLFHCAAGKDRTGVVAALVLACLGVEDEDIVADYVLTEANLEPILTRLRSRELYAEMLADSDLEHQRPRPEYLREFLSWVRERGGAASWLVTHGLDGQHLEIFREHMLGQ